MINKDTLRNRVSWAPLLMWSAVIILAAVTPGTLSSRGLMGFMGAVTPLLLIGIGLTGAIMAGTIDFGIVQIAEVAGLSMSVVLRMDGSWAQAVGTGVLFGVVIGLVNGLVVGFLHVSSLMTTLAMSLVITGGELLYMNGPQSVMVGSLMTPGSTAIQNFGWGQLGPFPYVFIVAAVVVIFAWVFLTRTTAGRSLSYVGNGSEAAWYSGRDSRWVALGSMVWSGFFGALGGLAFISQSGIAIPGGLASYLVPVFAAVLAGTVVGKRRRISLGTTIFGVVLIVALQNAVTVYGFEGWVMYVVEGTVVLGLFALMMVTSQVSARISKNRARGARVGQFS